MAHLNKIPSNLSKILVCSLRRNIYTSTKLLNTAKSEENEVAETELMLDQEEEEIRRAKIEQIRNKSRLHVQHRNILHGRVPYDEPMIKAHNSLKYKRSMFGKYGEASGVDPRICFYTQKELDYQREYEKVAYPHTLEEMIKINGQEKKAKLEAIHAREEKIAKNLEKLEQWKTDLQNRVAKKEKDARIARERKERLVEEVRRHFGFTVDARDERFKELLEKKEKEDKKQQKEAKRKAKEEKLMAKLSQDKPKEAPVEDSAT